MPFDKKTNYVKRCVGISGDTLEIKNGVYLLTVKNKTILIDLLFSMPTGLNLKTIII